MPQSPAPRSQIFPVTVEQIQAAQARIAPYIRKTPMIPFDYLSAKTGQSVLLKCEMLQHTGSFKIRGAANFILENLVQAKKCGVIAASAGNHAQGVASICHRLGIRSTIVMPTVTPPIKVENTRSWGATVELVGSVYDESFDYASKLAQAKGYLFVHPFRDTHIMAGQGTIALEMMAAPEFSEVEAVVIAIGGGGLISGCASAFKQLRPDIKIYGVSARNAPAGWTSFHKKSAVELDVRFTLADGIATRRTDPMMLGHMLTCVDEVVCLNEEAIAHAISLLAERAKLVTEGSGAIPVAAIIEKLVPEKNVAAILCGGNIDLPALSHVLERGMAEQGRLVRLLITVSDRPGGLNAITNILAEKGANILQVFHLRSNLQSNMGEAQIEIDMETRGQENTTEIIQALTERGYKVQRAS